MGPDQRNRIRKCRGPNAKQHRRLHCTTCDATTHSVVQSYTTAPLPRLLIVHLIRALQDDVTIRTAVVGLDLITVGGELYELRCVGAHKWHPNIRKRHFVAFESETMLGAYNVYDDDILKADQLNATSEWLPYVLVYERSNAAH